MAGLEKKAVVSFATTWMNLGTLYAKLKKPGTERQILHDLTYVESTRAQLKRTVE